MEPEFGFFYVIMDLIQTQTRVHSLTEEQLSQPDHMKEETHTKRNVNGKLICWNTDTYWINTNRKGWSQATKMSFFSVVKKENLQ